MRIVRIVIREGAATYLRDPVERGGFLCGVECNAWGIGVRSGCTEDPILMVRMDRIEQMDTL